MRVPSAALLLVALPLSAQTPLIDQGRALFEKRDYDHAVEVLEKAVAATPKIADAHFLLGAAYGQQAMTASLFSKMSLATKSKEQMEEAVKLDPNHLDARMGLVQFYTMAPSMAGGSDEKALEQATEIKKRDPFRGVSALGFVYNHAKKSELEHKEYADLVRTHPQSPRAHVMMATEYLGEKNFAAASSELDTALKLDPKYMPAWFWIGRTAVDSATNYPRGEEALRKYLGYTPKRDEPGLHRAYFWLGRICERTGRKAEAKANYQMSLKLRPDQKDVTEALKGVS